jgi:drug/metabolite transporter (DMT)-like permease
MIFLAEQVSMGQWLGIVIVMLGLAINARGNLLIKRFRAVFDISC